MTYFTIDKDNDITALATEPTATDTTEVFTSEKQLASHAAKWPISRLVEIWNSFAGVAPFGDLKPVKKFENRSKACARIFKACQVLAAALEPAATEPAKTPTTRAKADKAAPTTIRAGKATKATKAKATKPAGKPGAGTKQAQAIAMMERKGGATLDELMAKFGWQKHTVRGFVAGAVRKLGYAVISTKTEAGARTYQIEAK